MTEAQLDELTRPRSVLAWRSGRDLRVGDRVVEYFNTWRVARVRKPPRGVFGDRYYRMGEYDLTQESSVWTGPRP